MTIVQLLRAVAAGHLRIDMVEGSTILQHDGRGRQVGPVFKDADHPRLTEGIDAAQQQEAAEILSCAKVVEHTHALDPGRPWPLVAVTHDHAYGGDSHVHPWGEAIGS